ncbi:MAG: ATP-binding protein [Eubacterium sp.]|nr:ATP-binding protein [Eubacterium sp.]
MFVGRDKELALLNKQFHSRKNALVVVYGREGLGKTSLIKRLVEDKICVYYHGRELSPEEQGFYFEKKKEELAEYLIHGQGKICLVLDEFDQMQKANKSFFADLQAYYDSLPPDRVMVLLISSQTHWVKTSMAKDMGDFESQISLSLELKEFSFMEMTDRFPGVSTEDCLKIYAVLGGVPAYLDLWDLNKSYKENIKDLFLAPGGKLRREANRFLKTSLRELPYYNTILSVLGEDRPKLNYLYARTGFSRAKISVYIKHLIQMGVAGKISSFEPEKKFMVMKGLYCITDKLLHFYYKLIYPNLTEAEWLDPEDFYETYLREGLEDLCAQTYRGICLEMMQLMNQFNRLPDKFDSLASMYGKTGLIPIAASNSQGKILLGTCKWSQEAFDRQDFETLLEDGKQVSDSVDYLYLFAKKGFSKDFKDYLQSQENLPQVECIALDQM